MKDSRRSPKVQNRSSISQNIRHYPGNDRQEKHKVGVSISKSIHTNHYLLLIRYPRGYDPLELKEI